MSLDGKMLPPHESGLAHGEGIAQSCDNACFRQLSARLQGGLLNENCSQTRERLHFE
jgi:hypothetical protein